MSDFETLHVRRLENWRQTAQTRIPDAGAGANLIERVGLATLYPVSPEIPNLFHAYVGSPEATTDSGWDTPSGQVYAWRWEIGRPARACYAAIVRTRPTWVSWSLLPAVLRLRAALDAPHDLYAAGQLSAGALRIADALGAAGGALGTGELRQEAGFPTGKTQRAAFLRAIAELDGQLLLAKVFADGDTDMRHALVRRRYPDQVAAAERLTREAALDQLLAAYLPPAVYAVPPALAKALKLPAAEIRAGLERLVAADWAAIRTVPGRNEPIYVWNG